MRACYCTMKMTLPIVLGMMFAITISALAIVVCGRCGYEVNEGAASCSHCGAAVLTNVVTAVPQTKGEQGQLSADLVEKEMQEGIRYRDRGDPEVASALFRNAMALEQVVPDSGDAKRGERIRRLLQEGGAGVLMVQGQCPACGGSGKTSFSAPVLVGKTESVPTTVACRSCSGTGNAMRSGTASEVAAARSSAAKRYVALQQSRKYVAVGGAWVPVSVETNLTVRQTALLKRTAAPSCQVCLGIGLLECSACRGAGRLPCSNRKCNRGVVVEKAADGLKGADLARKAKCRTCGGTGYERCAHCAGKGQLACSACNGTGERLVCDRCDGAGIQSCAKCLGSGKIKGNACAACRGEGVALCATCKGDGRKR